MLKRTTGPEAAPGPAARPARLERSRREAAAMFGMESPGGKVIPAASRPAGKGGPETPSQRDALAKEGALPLSPNFSPTSRLEALP